MTLFSRILAALMTLLMTLLPFGAGSTGTGLYSLSENGEKVYHDRAGYIQIPYSAEECRAEAERLFSTPFTVTDVQTAESGLYEAVVTLVSDKFAFPLHVTSFYDAVQETVTGRTETVLYAHAHCDYYEAVMQQNRPEADALAAQYGLVIERSGQDERVAVSGYEQLANVIEYLDAANNLYDFAMDEGYMAGILRDVIRRPALIPYIPGENDGTDILTLYYVVNHESFPYVKTSLLPALQEAYIGTLDAAGVADPSVTDAVRAERVKPALTQLCLNGVPLEAKDMGGWTLDPNIVFTYNWLAKSYTGDIRLCFPAADYDAAPDLIGDDRSFRYLVELLGGMYESRQDDSLRSDYYTAKWELGGNLYGAGSFYNSYIPVMSAFSINGSGVSIDVSYSKDMWGLEDGYSTDDFYLRITPEGLGTLLGVNVEPDYENGTLNLVTPEGYFDYAPVEEEKTDYPPRFKVSNILSENGLAVMSNRYVIYDAEGNVLEDAVTSDYVYADCTQVTEAVVMVHISGAGSVDRLIFFDTDSGAVNKAYNAGSLLKYPYIAYSPSYSGKIYEANVDTGAEALLVEGALETTQCLTSARLLPGRGIQLTYLRKDSLGWWETVTETVPDLQP